MDNMLTPYECQFSAEERKQLIGESITQVRKTKGYSQKEVASWIGISQATYSAYERGRNEPPAEILVRLAYLYSCRVDDLVQRDRLRKEYKDSQELIDDLKLQIAKYEEVVSRWTGGVSPEMQALTAEMGKMLDRMEKMDLSE